jgi:hypothetical protein
VIYEKQHEGTARENGLVKGPAVAYTGASLVNPEPQFPIFNQAESSDWS